VEVLAIRVGLVRLGIPRRDSDIVTRCYVTREQFNQRLCPRQRQFLLGEDLHRLVVWLDVSRGLVTPHCVPALGGALPTLVVHSRGAWAARTTNDVGIMHDAEILPIF
jgi:hypothetical protein